MPLSIQQLQRQVTLLQQKIDSLQQRVGQLEGVVFMPVDEEEFQKLKEEVSFFAGNAQPKEIG